MRNDIKLYELKYDKEDIRLIGHKTIAIDKLILNLDEWHNSLTDIILCPNNIYYYATNNFDSDEYLENLPEENLKDVRSALSVIIDSPNAFYNEYKQKSEYYWLVEKSQSIAQLYKIVSEYGIKIKTGSIVDLNKAKVEVHRKLCMDYCFGVFGEMLFYIVVENVLCNRLVLSKVALITAPKTNAHGSDGIFCDDRGKILYFGESKFTYDIEKGISQALKSMDDCLDRIKMDKDFLLVHKKDMKNGYGRMIGREDIDKYECRIIIFLLHGKETTSDEIICKIKKARNSFRKKLAGIKFSVISFPIYDKDNLKKCLAKGVKSFGK